MGELANVIGLVLSMTVMLHGEDGGQHKESHIHVFHRKGMSVYSLQGEYMRGIELSGDERKALKLWCQIHNDELKANWSLALERIAYP